MQSTGQSRSLVTHIAGLCQVLGLFSLMVGTAFAQLPDRIKLGSLHSRTGAFAQANVSPGLGVAMAVAEINKTGGIAGKQVDIVAGDDQTDPTNAVNEARRLTAREKIHILVGPFSSQLTLAIQPIMNEARIANISTSGTTQLTPQVGNWHFSINPPADAQGRALGAYIATTMKAKSVGYIGDNGAQAKATLEALKADLRARNIPLTGEQEFTIGANDMTPQLLALRRGNPEVLVMITNKGEDHANITLNLKELGWKIPLLGGVGATYITSSIKTNPQAYDNFASVGVKAASYCANDPVGTGVFSKFRERVRVFEPQNFDRLDTQTTGWTYDAVFILKAAIEATRSVDGPTLTRWIEQNVAKVSSVLGPYHASATSHFFFDSPDAMTLVENPHKPRSDGLIKRAGC